MVFRKRKYLIIENNMLLNLRAECLQIAILFTLFKSLSGISIDTLTLISYQCTIHSLRY